MNYNLKYYEFVMIIIFYHFTIFAIMSFYLKCYIHDCHCLHGANTKILNLVPSSDLVPLSCRLDIFSEKR